jgi:simple sugar transport system permease protein
MSYLLCHRYRHPGQLLSERTRRGLNLRAVGENPATADAAGSTSRNISIWPPYGGGHLGAGRPLLRHGLYPGHTWANDGNHRGTGLAGRSPCYLCALAEPEHIWGSYLFGLLVWALLLYTRSDPFLAGDLQDASLLSSPSQSWYWASLRDAVNPSLRRPLGLPYFREER